MELQRNELLWILPVSSSWLQFSWIQFGVWVLRMGSSKRLPHDFERDLPHRNSTEWDDTFLQATWIFHDYMGFWLFIQLEQKLFSSFAAWLWYHFSVHCVKLRIGNYIWCWGCSGFPDRCNSSAREQPSLVASLQDSAISRSHWSLSQLKANLLWNVLIQSPQHTPFFSFLLFFLTWIPVGSWCKSFQLWFTMEQEGFPLEKHLALRMLTALGKLMGCSQAGQVDASRKVWLT